MKCNIKIKSAHTEPMDPFTYFMTGDRYWTVKCISTGKRTFQANRIGGPGSQWKDPFLNNIDEALKLPFGNWNTLFFKVSFLRWCNILLFALLSILTTIVGIVFFLSVYTFILEIVATSYFK